MGLDILLLITLAGLAGALIGTFTGLVPGIHVNTVATLLLGSYPFMESFSEGLFGPGSAPLLVSCCILSASVVHSFVDFVPSVFIGVPDADEVLSALPGHRLFLEGKGMVAVRSAAIGSIVGSISAVFLSIPLQFILLSGGADLIEHFTFGVLLIITGVIVFSSESPAWSCLLLGLSGILGFAVQSEIIPIISVLKDGTMLFPLLTGLFGLPPLLEKRNRRRPIRQRDPLIDPIGPVPGLKGVATGIIAGWFPGVTSTAGALLASVVSKDDSPERFISMTASIGTVTAVFSIVTLSVSGSGRSGTSMAIKSIIGDSLTGFCSQTFVIMLFCIILASVAGYAITVLSGKMMVRISEKLPEELMNDIILIMMLFLVLLFTGPFGLGLLTVSAALGMIPPYLGISRVCLTGCLTIPVLAGLLL